MRLTRLLFGSRGQDRAGKIKIFYVSLQRCGTKSFGQFFRRNGFRVASWEQTKKHGWNEIALAQGRFQQLVNSTPFNAFTVFEDGPWFEISVIRFLYWAVPNSRFIYFHRPVEDWFKSMLALNHGLIIGDPKRHCLTYERLNDYYEAIAAGRSPAELRMDDHFEHYKTQFENHALRIKAFFEDKPSNRFFSGDLYDAEKWMKLNAQFGLELKDMSDVHIHKSPKNRPLRKARR